MQQIEWTLEDRARAWNSLTYSQHRAIQMCASWINDGVAGKKWSDIDEGDRATLSRVDWEFAIGKRIEMGEHNAISS